MHPKSSQSSKDNKILSRITLITSLGDWLTYFALMKLATDVSGSVVIGTLSIAMKSAAVAAGAILMPMFVGAYTARAIILGTQWLSAALITGISASIVLKISLPVPVLYSVLFLQTILEQLFDAARESHSRGLAQTDDDHRPMQAQILRGLFGAQFFGPLIAFALLLKTPVWLLLLVDGLSFVLAGFLALGIGPSSLTQVGIQPTRFLRPFSYLKKQPYLRDILILRSIVFWIPNGLYNILLFQIVLHHYQLPLGYSAIPYAVLGSGAAAASLFFRYSKTEASTWLGRLSDGTLACMAQILFALSTLGFLAVHSFAFAMSFVFFTGIAMGVNAISTQALRRRFSTAEQLPEIMGLELLLGRITDVVVMTTAATAIQQGILPYKLGVEIAIGLFVLSGLAHLRFKTAS